MDFISILDMDLTEAKIQSVVFLYDTCSLLIGDQQSLINSRYCTWLLMHTLIRVSLLGLSLCLAVFQSVLYFTATTKPLTLLSLYRRPWWTLHSHRRISGESGWMNPTTP